MCSKELVQIIFSITIFDLRRLNWLWHCWRQLRLRNIRFIST
jgi:hypothetical protein